MGRLDQRKRGPLRRAAVASDVVTNRFAAIDLVYPLRPVPEPEQTELYRARLASARRLLGLPERG